MLNAEWKNLLLNHNKNAKFSSKNAKKGHTAKNSFRRWKYDYLLNKFL